MESAKLFNIQEVLAQVISFLLLLFCLRIFLWKKVLKFLDDRKQRIATELKQIEEAKLDVSKIKQDYQDKVDKIEELALQKIRESIEEGHKLTEEIKKKAYQDAQDIIANARASVKYQLNKAKQEIKEDIVNMALLAAQNLVQERLTEQDDKKIVENFLDNLDEK
ncbi:MAG: F0F1 ATP synthase subunit B [Candidatus Omnitrophica bacterium]|jgi:F-type H+-transporting ATPase subunit b|nr:F0F1 ATP synthase subunit B [Candidatus Omnitrophota bacterium]